MVRNLVENKGWLERANERTKLVLDVWCFCFVLFCLGLHPSRVGHEVPYQLQIQSKHVTTKGGEEGRGKWQIIGHSSMSCHIPYNTVFYWRHPFLRDGDVGRLFENTVYPFCPKNLVVMVRQRRLRCVTMQSKFLATMRSAQPKFTGYACACWLGC